MKFSFVPGTQTSRMILAGTLTLAMFCSDTISGALAVETAMSSISSPGSPSSAAPAVESAPSLPANTKPPVVNIQELPAIVDIPQTPESVEKVQKLEKDGETLFKIHQLDKALAKWQEAYGLSLEMKYSEGEGRALVNMCRIFLDRGQFVKAKYMGENAIEVLSGVSDRQALGRAHLYLAQAYYGLDNAMWAGEQLSLALKEFTADGNNNSVDTAHLMTLGASVLIKIGKPREALQFLQASVTYYEQANDVVAAMNTQTQIIEMLLGLGLFTAASQEADRAISVGRNNPDKPFLLITALSTQANCKYCLGEYGASKRLYDQILPLIKALPDHKYPERGLASVLLGYGSALGGVGDYELAVPVLERAMNLFKSLGQTAPEAQCVNMLGCVYEELGQREKARQYLEQALDLQNVVIPKQDRFRSTILANLASIEARSSANSNAHVHFENAVSLAKGLKDATLLGRLYCGETETLMKLAEAGEAERIVRLAISASEPNNDDAALWREYTLLAKILSNRGDNSGAHEALTSALSFFRSPQAGVFASPERESYPSTRKEAASQLVGLLAANKMTEQALQAAEQEKERVFITNWTNYGGSVRPDDADLYKELAELRVHLHAAESLSPPSRIVKEWQNWMARFKTVAQQNKAVARLVGPIPTAMADIIRGVQKSNATVLEYFLGDDSTTIFTINGAGRLTATIVPVGSKRIDAQVAALYNAFPRADNPSPQAALNEKRILQSLYSELLPQGVRSFIPNDAEHHLIVIADGSLFNVPFAALINEQQKYMVENHTITIVPSIATLLDTPNKYTDEMNGAVVAQQNEQATALVSAFTPGAVQKFVGRDVDYKSAVEQSRGKEVLEFAEPIAFSAGEPLWAEGTTVESRRFTPDKLTPMGVNNDLVVFGESAVNSKDKDGKTVQLLGRTVSYSGGRNTLMSLWDPSLDDKTSELGEFYRNLQSNGNQADALRKTQLNYVSKDAPPHEWAAYQLLGVGQ